jgi:hypothetical protein
MTVPKSGITLVGMEILLDISISLSIAFARRSAFSGRAVSTFQINIKKNSKSLKFRLDTHRLTVFKRAGQKSELINTFFRKSTFM